MPGQTKRVAPEASEESKASPAKRQRTDAPVDTKEGFLVLYGELSEAMVADFADKYEMPQAAQTWIKEMLDYTTPGGKLNRGLTVVHSLQLMAGDRKLSSKELRQAAVLGWCIEWLQACFLVADDLMDDSVTRRGAPCWYRRPEVRNNAVNDSFILRSGVSWLLKREFEDHPAYMKLVEIFRETTLQTELGQLLDLTSAPADRSVDLTRFSIDRYNKIVKYKTAFYSFYLPVACAMIVADNASTAALSEACEILVDMGTYFQIQDDVLDCYGAPEVIGKIGTDIQDNKCGWLVVQALDRATPTQKKLLQENYAKDDPECVARVKALYTELELKAAFDKVEAESYDRLVKRIGAASHVPAVVYNTLLKKIYKREK